MANPDHVAMLQRGAYIWNEWRKNNPGIRPDLHDASLFEISLSGVNLNGANLFDAWLSWACLRKADLRNTDLGLAHLEGTILIGADLRNANLVGTDLTNANLVDANLADANLLACRIAGASVWNVNLQGTKQCNLIITSPTEPTITVDDLEAGQILYSFLNNGRIGRFIDTVVGKVVLILGRFTPERKAVLDAIRDELRRHDYLPVVFDFDKPATRDITETMRTLAHLSRFIIADISDPGSIPLELQAVVPDLAVPVQPLLLSGQREFSMFVDLRKKYHWVLAPHQYADISDLLASLGDKVIVPAEQKAKELEKR
jgi:Pentapeptide repeats (8 copies)